MKRLFEGACPIDTIYIKVKDKYPISTPLCEIVEGRVVKDKTDEYSVCLLVRRNGNEEQLVYNRKQFKDVIQNVIGTCYENKKLIVEDFALQIEGDFTSNELDMFVNKYS